MHWRNVGLIFHREVIDQLRDRRTLFMIAILPVLLYPALGIGMVQLTVLFAEQPRTVVILDAAALPPPALIEGDRFVGTWFRVPAEADKLLVVTDAEPSSPLNPEQKQHREQLLENARALRTALDEQNAAVAQLEEAERTGDLTSMARLREQHNQISERLTELFGRGNIQALIVVPPDFARNLARLKQDVVARDKGVADFDYERPLIVHNSADEKSLIAASRVQRVFDAWEREILKQSLQEVGLPASLPAPVNAAEVDLAQQQQLSANVWSKLFPALLVLMTLTGAFHPAIDLGAGEKERGTMETLLICPATRTEIVLGKFCTVMLFSAGTALLNLASLGLTGKYMVALTAGATARMGDLSLPPLTSLVWVFVMLLPLAALFSALCLAFATFARSSKEGQYYLTPLLMVTLGLTVFCLSPAVEMQPFYSVLPVMGPALLLKGLLLANHQHSELIVYAIPVLLASLGYAAMALWWAIDQFGSEDVLFREAERFDLRLWIRHLLRDKEATPTFAEAGFCFVLIMFLQFAALRVMQTPLQNAAPEARGVLMLQLLIIQQLVIVATPAMLMAVMLTTSLRDTLLLRWPRWQDLCLAAALPLALHPLSLEFAASLQWFFPPLPPSIGEVLGAITRGDLPWWLPLLAFAVAPAICEEVAFRGFILSGFNKTGRARLAIGLSAVTFGLMHMIPQQVLNATLLGLVLGLIAVRSQSLLPGIAFHLIYNGLEVCRRRLGDILPTTGVGEWFFRLDEDSSLRYQPLLLVLCGLVALTIISRFARRRTAIVASPAPWTTPFNMTAAPANAE